MVERIDHTAFACTVCIDFEGNEKFKFINVEIQRIEIYPHDESRGSSS